MVAGVDLRALPIGPKEAFVLSLVDGWSDVDDIALVTGIEPEAVQSGPSPMSTPSRSYSVMDAVLP